MNKTLLAVSIQVCLIAGAYAAESVDGAANIAATENSSSAALVIDATTPPDLVPVSETPVAASETPVAESETPVAESETPVAESETPVAESETPVAESETPVAESETPVAESETPVEQNATAEPEVPTAPVQETITTNVVATEAATPSLASQPTTSMNPEPDSAAAALQQKKDDATQETNLQEVFTSNERQYSLIKKGEISTFYDLDYTYYRDTRLDLAIEDGVVNQLRVEEDASHTYTNTISLQYGLKDNVTLSTSIPFVAKTDNLKDTSTAGLGDINFGARWEPFPLKADRLPLILFGSLSTKTGDSPYEINAARDLSTGKGYYSVGVGASTRKYIDPVVLFGSISANYGFAQTDLNQVRGSRLITEFEPGISGGFAFGFAYSFNYDVSLTMSYQQSFNLASQFTYSTGETFKPADQTSASFAIALGVRTSPDTIINGTMGIGLTEDAPDVSLGLSFPLDILNLKKKTTKKSDELARGATRNASR